MKSITFTLVLAVVFASNGCAQADGGVPLERGRTYKLQSVALGQTRTIDVSLPAGYATDTALRYPTLFVLDGSFEQEMAAGIARYYADAGKVPPMIVVGIRNPDRFHELTTSLAPGWPGAPDAPNPGGARDFLRFVGNELVPWVQRTFRTDSTRVLVGHSLGGLFALYALAQRPELFTGFVLMEPSAWWNDEQELRAAVETLRTPKARHMRVMAVNMKPLSLDTASWGGNAPMVRELATVGENHTSMAVAGLSQALRTMFADFLPSEWEPGKRPIAMLERYDSLAFRLGYPIMIPEAAYATVARMSVDSRFYDDAVAVIDRMEKARGVSAESRGLRDMLAKNRANEKPGFVQLVFSARRPTPAQAKKFLGRWVVQGETAHVVEVKTAGDTIIVYEEERMPSGMRWEGNRPVIQLTSDGVLEWGVPVFRGLAALLVLRGQVQADGTMVVTREVRGWVPLGPGPDLDRREVFRRR
jgi:predicted alpha/beta superfamily hydrolase